MLVLWFFFDPFKTGMNATEGEAVAPKQGSVLGMKRERGRRRGR